MQESKVTLEREDVSGAYFIAGSNGDKRFTVYAYFPFDKAALALDDDALMTDARAGGGSVEEVDVNALNETEARTIAQEALKQDYVGGSRILACEERVGWYM